MFIEETFKRAVRIEGAPDAMHGYKLTVRDIETGEEIVNVSSAVIYLAPGELNCADLTYYQMNEKGRMAHHPDRAFEPIIGTVRCDNPEIAITAYEREQPTGDHN